jgi:DNA repair exonuclease SbcCD ATPase subunit
MRNDALDELEVVPSLTTDVRDRTDYGYATKPQSEPKARSAPAAAGSKQQPSAKARTAPLWALLVAVLIAFGSLAWWSAQQIALLNRQLVATQLSFAQISEEAAGRIKDISGKVVATESTATTETESLKLRVKQLETRLEESGKLQQNLLGQQSGQSKQLGGLATDLQSQQAALKLSDDKLQTLAAAQEKLQAAQATLTAVDARSKAQAADIEALKQQAKGLVRLEQDLLVLRSQLDNQASKGNNTTEFDAFRAQMTRSLSGLQSQIQTLQQQISGKQ